MITCGHFARSASDKAMKERSDGDDFSGISWINWRSEKQAYRQDVIIVPPNTHKFLHEGKPLNPTEDPLMVYRGKYLQPLLSIYTLNV